MPPLSITNVISFIPTNVWTLIKKFLKKDPLTVFDAPFVISTKYTPALLVIMMCLSFANQFMRNVEIDCAHGNTPGTSSGARGGGYTSHQSSSNNDADLNDYCWNHDTFLVVRSVLPSARGSVTYPGVSGYNREKDKIIRQRYYKQVWFGLGVMCVMGFLPLFLWKARGHSKMQGLINLSPHETEDNSEEEVRVSYFIETIGFNQTFAWCYLLCKLLALVTPLVMWAYSTGFIGQRYKWYGWDVMNYLMDSSDDPWPNPMDVLFPKMAKCEWAHYGFGGDIEVKSAQCQLPMNNLTQWSFFVIWWWAWFTFMVNLFSVLRLLVLYLFPRYRRKQYKQMVERACPQELEKARHYTFQTLGGEMLSRRSKKSDVILVNISFGDWLILSFLKRNLADWQFREFIRKLVVTENVALQLRPMPPIVMEKGGGRGKDPSAPNDPSEMGFIYPLQFNHPPPTYSACGSAAATCTTASDQVDCDNDTENNDAISSTGESSLSSIGNTSVTLLINENPPTTINITPPVKVQRVRAPHDSKSKMKGGPSGSGVSGMRGKSSR